MSNDPNSFYQERQQKNREAQQQEIRGTLETVNLEKQNANQLGIPNIVVNIFALIGVFAVLYVAVDLFFG